MLYIVRISAIIAYSRGRISRVFEDFCHISLQKIAENKVFSCCSDRTSSFKVYGVAIKSR